MSDASSTSQLVPALTGVAGVLVGALISWGVQVRLLGRRIEADERLAQRKFDFDKAIAERRFQYDRELHDHKRRTELAEQALTAFYEARGALETARISGSLGSEGNSRTPAVGETKTQQEQRNTRFIPIERLTRERAVFARLQSLSFAFTAHFGAAATEPFNAILAVYSEIILAANLLIEITQGDHAGDAYKGSAPPLLATLGWGPNVRPDDLDRKIQKAIQDIEKVCRPVLSETSVN